MINLPRAIGQLKNLRILNASKNQLEFIPDTIIQLTKIKSIDLSDNKLKHLSRWIGNLPSLLVLDLNSNQLAKLPREIANLLDLVTLDISHNPLKSIPAEISTLKSLRKLLAEGCEFEPECTDELKHDPPSLFEICARNVVKSNIPLPVGITKNITDYLKTCQKCTFCHGPFFDSYVGRSRIIERTARQLIVLDYKLCSAHWTDENDRMTAMFSTSYYTTPSINSSPSDKNIPHPDAQENNTNFADSNSSLFHQDDSIISQQFSQESLVSSSAQSPCSEQEDPIHNLLSERPGISTASSSSSSSAFINRPRALSTGTSMKKYNQHIEASSTHNQEESTSQHHILPFAQLRGRQSEEADRIMGIQRPALTRKTNGFIQSFEKLGAKLSRKPVNGRDRSGTL
jgi:Leucine-rich repeat (LRR) protein